MYASLLILILGADPQPYDVTVKRVATAGYVDVEKCACKIYLMGTANGKRVVKGMGSGVNTEKGVVTCYHVIDGQRDIEVACCGETAVATVVVIDRDYDLALLSVPWNSPHEKAKMASESPTDGKTLRSAGRCKDGTISVEHHEWLSTDKNDIEFTNCANSGRSGAGLFNWSGELVGIIHGNRVEKEPYTGLARDINHVVRLGSQYTPGKPVAAATPKPPAVQNCPNGNCPLQQPQQQFWQRRIK